MNDLDLFSYKYFGTRYNNSEDRIQIPNEIFYLLRKGNFKSGKHLLFSFIYYLNVAWVYRYCKINDILNNNNSYSDIMKELSGISKNTKTFEYIIKRNGVLDSLSITDSVSYSDVPAIYNHNNNNNNVDFIYNNQYRISDKRFNSVVIKEPLLHTHKRVIDNVEYLGAFHDYEFTFKVKMSDYIFMRDNLKLKFDVIAFYYYLSSMIYYGNGKVNISRKSIARQLNISEKTVTEYKNQLKKHDLLYEIKHSSYITRKNDTLIIRKVDDKYGTSNTI